MTMSEQQSTTINTSYESHQLNDTSSIASSSSSSSSSSFLLTSLQNEQSYLDRSAFTTKEFFMKSKEEQLDILRTGTVLLRILFCILLAYMFFIST